MAGQGPPAKRRHVAAAAVEQQHAYHSSSTNGSSTFTTTTTTTFAGPRISDGARLSYADLNQASPPQDPSSDLPLAPVIDTAIVNPTSAQARLVLSPGCEEDDVFPIFLMHQQAQPLPGGSGSSITDIERAYAILPHKKPIPLHHGDPTFHREWGCLYYGIAYQRDDDHRKQHEATNDVKNDVLPAIFRVPNVEDKTGVLARAVTPDNPIYVAIKKINKQAVAHALNGKNVLREDAYGENPYKEIARMQEMGDNRHVIKCLDALQDDDYLYIITPWALGGDLKDWIWNVNGNGIGGGGGHFDATTRLWTPAAATRNGSASSSSLSSRSSSNRTMIGTYFCHILDILAYLELFNLHHRDLSPDNFLFLDQERTILVAMDLAMSVRIPTTIVATTAAAAAKTNNYPSQQEAEEEEEEPQRQQQQQRTLIHPIGRFGTVGWMAPEIYFGFAFDGVGCDLWSCMLILYNLLTRQILYQYPHPADISFRYFVHAGGLTYNRINERTIQIQMEVFNDDNGSGGSDTAADAPLDPAAFAQRKLNQHTLLTKSQCHVEFSREIRELFHHFFRAPPTERWTLAQVMESSYVQQHRRRLQQQNQHHQPRAVQR
jgi:serine/threonine protein kinase